MRSFKVPYIAGFLFTGVSLYTGFTENWLLENAAPQFLIIGLAILALTLYLQLGEKKARNFYNFIISKSAELKTGQECKFEGKIINKDTELRRYYWAMSYVFISFKGKTRFYIEKKSSLIKSLMFSFLTFISGWWGIPFGPIWTIEAIIKNFKGGDSFTVDNLLSLASDEFIEK